MKKSTMIFLAMACLMLTSCAGSMTPKQVYQLPSPSAISEGINRSPYTVYWFPMHGTMKWGEGHYGVRHDLYLKDSENKEKYELSTDNHMGTRAFRNGKWYVMVIDYEGKIDPNKKGYIGSRVSHGRRHQYSLDGKKVYGLYEEMFSWDKIQTIEETGIETWKNVMPDSEQNTEVAKILGFLANEIEKVHRPGLFEKTLKRLGKITKDDLVLGVAGDFKSLFLLVGVRFFPVVMDLTGQPDLNLPYYETGNVDVYRHAKDMHRLEKKFDTGKEEDDKAMQAWRKEMSDYQKKKEDWEQEFKKIKQ